MYYGLNHMPQNDMPVSKPPATSDLTLFLDRVFTDVIKLKRVISMASKANEWYS